MHPNCLKEMAVEISNDKFRQVILSAIADKEMINIMEFSTNDGRSVNAAIKELGISHSSAYRKIKWMLDEGLPFTERIQITPDGKKFSLFRSTLKSINVSYVNGIMTVKVEYNIRILEKTAERLFSLSRS